jgi:anti-anti-sigma factor
VSLSISRSIVDGILVVRLSGNLDLSTVPVLSDALTRIARDDDERVAVDVDGLVTIDDAAVGVLLGAASRASANGRVFVIISSVAPIRSLLRSTRLDVIVPVLDSLDDVVRSNP